MPGEPTKGTWAEAFLHARNYPATQTNKDAVIAWQAQENPQPGSKMTYNPVGSTWDSSPVGSGKQTRGQFPNWRGGIEFVHKNLEQTGGRYSDVVALFKQGNVDPVKILTALYKPNDVAETDDGPPGEAGRKWGENWKGLSDPNGGTLKGLSALVANAAREATEPPDVNIANPGVLVQVKDLPEPGFDDWADPWVDAPKPEPGSEKDVYDRLKQAEALADIIDQNPPDDSLMPPGWTWSDTRERLDREISRWGDDYVSGKNPQDAAKQAGKRNPDDGNATTLTDEDRQRVVDIINDIVVRYRIRGIVDDLGKSGAPPTMPDKTPSPQPRSERTSTNPPITKLALNSGDTWRFDVGRKQVGEKAKVSFGAEEKSGSGGGWGGNTGGGDGRSGGGGGDTASTDTHPTPDPGPSGGGGGGGRDDGGGLSAGEVGAIVLAAALVAWAALMAALESMNIKTATGGASRGDEPGALEEGTPGGSTIGNSPGPSGWDPDQWRKYVASLPKGGSPFGSGDANAMRRWMAWWAKHRSNDPSGWIHPPDPDPDRDDYPGPDEAILQNWWRVLALFTERQKIDLAFHDPDPLTVPESENTAERFLPPQRWKEFLKAHGAIDPDEARVRFGAPSRGMPRGGEGEWLDRRFQQIEENPVDEGYTQEPDRPYEGVPVESIRDPVIDHRRTIATRQLIDAVGMSRSGRLL